MRRNFEEALMNRRSYYKLSDASPVTDEEVIHIVHAVVKHVPSAFNSQSTRLILLLGDEHRKLWDIVKQTLKKLIPADAYIRSEAKINQSFASGHGTVLFFEDQSVVMKYQKEFPLYSENFSIWSQHTSAMHQFAVWVMLEDLGFGASLQHYNPLIDEEVQRIWHLPADWKLVAQMPYGMAVQPPGEKKFQPLEGRVKVFR